MSLQGHDGASTLSAMANLEDIWSMSSTSTVAWDATAVTPTPSESSSTSSAIPPSTGMEAAASLFTRMTSNLPANPNPEASQEEEDASLKIDSRKRKIDTSVGEDTAVKKELFACDICGELRGRLDRHYEKAHKLDKESAKARAKVQKSLTGRGHKVLSCPECGKVVRYLADHLSNVHHVSRGTDASLDLRKKAKLSLELSSESQPPAEVMRRKDNTRSTAIVGLGGSVGCAVRLETRRSRVQPPPRSATFFRED